MIFYNSSSSASTPVPVPVLVVGRVVGGKHFLTYPSSEPTQSEDILQVGRISLNFTAGFVMIILTAKLSENLYGLFI